MTKLIYSCIFVNIEYLELAELLLKSYKLFGGAPNDIDYLIFCNPNFKDKIQVMFNNLKINGKIWCLDLHTKFDACCARLKIFDYPDIDLYDKILYLDCDILVTNPIATIFDIPLENKLYAIKDGNTSHEYWGGGFFENDLNIDAFSSGILLFNNDIILKRLFLKIISHIGEELNNHNYEPLFNQKKEVDFNKLFGDQPFIVYAAIKSNLYDNTKLIEFIVNNPDVNYIHSLEEYATITHFPGGPGYCKNKLYKMIKFITMRVNIKLGRGVPPLPLITKTHNQVVKNTMFPLIGICVSYNYMDTLKFMIPINYNHFDKIYLITQEDDNETIEFCKGFPNVEVLLFTFKTDAAVFNKGGALKMGQKIAYDNYPDHWYLIIDSDIILPNNFIDILKNENLNENYIYGAVRNNIETSSQLFKPIIPDHKWTQNDMTFNWQINAKVTGPGILGSFQLYKLKKIYKPSSDLWFNGADYDFYFAWINFNIFCQLENIVYLHLGFTAKNWNGKVKGFIDDANIDLEQCSFKCNIRCINSYYNIRKKPVKAISDDTAMNIWGCSEEFKQDIKYFFKDEIKSEIVEVGSHRGYTTRFLSTIFGKVYSVDNKDNWTTSFNKELNKDRINIKYINSDIYNKSYSVTRDIETVFINGPFNYEQCKKIICNLPEQFHNLKYIIMDNYGVCNDIKKCINKWLDCELLIGAKYMGLNNIQTTHHSVKNTSEGIICKINLLLYKSGKWEQFGRSSLEKNQIIPKKPEDLLIKKTQYMSCSRLNKSGISQISIK